MAFLGNLVRLAVVLFAVWTAYDIRLYAIREFGRLIHEFDPWFNFHATRYMFENGLKKFFTWFDHTAWYPLGRPVGTTIYPGMQLTSVGIWHVLDRIGLPMSLNDICVFVPAWFGAIATVLVGLLAAECSGSKNALPAAAMVMSVIPAHIMRSVGGGYDNESIAVSAMTLTFWLWTRSLRNERSWPVGALAGLAYVYMVAAWGGYVFVLNMVGVHAGVLMLIELFVPKALKEFYGDFNFVSVIKAYTLFFVIGTLGAIQVPVVSWTPLRSMEQIGPLLVFCAYQVLGLCEVLRRRAGYAPDSDENAALRRKVFMVLGSAGVVALSVLLQRGHFAGLSIRVRGLFIQHTKTGNPLVDSVAEHQPASASAYWHYLREMCSIAPVGFFLCFHKPNNGRLFLIMYGAIAYFFSNKMNRLIILLGPITSALAGVALGAAADFIIAQGRMLVQALEGGGKAEENAEKAQAKEGPAKAGKKAGKTSKGGKASGELAMFMEGLWKAYESTPGRACRLAAAMVLLVYLPDPLMKFYNYSRQFAEHSSQPSIVYSGHLQNGQKVYITDYLDSYLWLKENTPEDSRVMSWWDYGYQISGIANRTTLADGNTWNLEHISMIARCLTSGEKKAHGMIKHLADYVLVWSGGGGDDLAKLPHIARIGNSVYPDICGEDDPLCRTFSFYDQNRTPMPKVAKSIVYKMVEAGDKPGVGVDEKYFKQVYISKYRKVRIYEVQKVSKKSKKWLANPKNRKCDAPGSWYCPGQYPPDFPEYIGTSHAHLDYAKHGHDHNLHP